MLASREGDGHSGAREEARLERGRAGRSWGTLPPRSNAWAAFQQQLMLEHEEEEPTRQREKGEPGSTAARCASQARARARGLRRLSLGRGGPLPGKAKPLSAGQPFRCFPTPLREAGQSPVTSVSFWKTENKGP